MSAIFSVILILFWVSVFGMVFGNTQISEICRYFFYGIAPLAVIRGIYETVYSNDQSTADELMKRQSKKK
jgi:hypothetical protein